jgi:2-dehydro-3-deoxyphosphogluconate aldolase/(4S)-4-hydroxy-2-oxoglutarate aldolase
MTDRHGGLFADWLAELKETGIIAILRGIPDDRADRTAEALVDGGIRFIEVTMNTEGALEMIRRWTKRLPADVRIGAGTVLDEEMASAAIDAGATFLVTPNADEGTIRRSVASGIPIVAGAMTPTEIAAAWKWGAPAVKVFPAGTLGPGYFRELQGPLSHIPMVATGGIRPDNMAEYRAAGAAAFGLGSALVNAAWIRDGDYARMTENAMRCVAAAAGGPGRPAGRTTA